MRLISHRGNISGRVEIFENNPSYINIAISQGFDVEIDIWFENGKLWLGHDNPQYPTDINWLKINSSNLWIHCKNIGALDYFKKTETTFNYFFHQNDDVTITSNGHFWTYPGKQLTENSIACMPELKDFQNIEFSYGICSDFISKYKKRAVFCFWGQVRGDFSIIKYKLVNLFQNYNIDFLLSTWENEQVDESHFDFVIRSISPTDEFLDIINFPYTQQIQSNYRPRNWRYGHYAQYFHTQKIYDFIKTNNLNYDILCKSRADLLFDSAHKFDFDKDICFIPKNYHCEIGLNDHFMIGNFRIMKKVICIEDLKEVYPILENSWNPEIALQIYLTKNNVNVIEFNCESYKLLPDRDYPTK